MAALDKEKDQKMEQHKLRVLADNDQELAELQKEIDDQMENKKKELDEQLDARQK